MLWKNKKKKDFNYVEAYSNFYKDYLDDSTNEDNKHFYEFYNKIKIDYINKIEIGDLCICEEIARLKKKKGDFDNGTRNNNLNFIVGILTALLNGIVVAYSTLQSEYKFAIIIFITIFFFAYSFFNLWKDKTNSWIHGLCLQVLEDIEQEIKEQQEKPVNKIQYNGCNWIGSKELPDFNNEKSNNIVDIGVWFRFAKEIKKLIK